MMFSRVSEVIWVLCVCLVAAQRPEDASICDYYAQKNFGANNSATQYTLIQGIITLAFGGNFNLPNVSSEITGVFHPGVYQGSPVDLGSFFNGSIDSTNLNNQAVGINWLDEGLDPIESFLSGKTTSLELKNGTNQARLFEHFFGAFSHIFGCSNPPPSHSTGPPLSLAYVHKFMNLTHTDLGYFIDMLTLSTAHYGFSSVDSQTFSSSMNNLYNVRCAPPITLNPARGPELLSLCQNPSCPLAEPNPDCAAYADLTPYGVQTTSVLPLSTQLATPAPSSTSPAAGSSTSPPLVVSSDNNGLSGGAIAGIVIGVVAAILLAILVALLCFRMGRQREARQAPQRQPSFYGDPHMSAGPSIVSQQYYRTSAPVHLQHPPRPDDCYSGPGSPPLPPGEEREVMEIGVSRLPPQEMSSEPAGASSDGSPTLNGASTTAGTSPRPKGVLPEL